MNSLMYTGLEAFHVRGVSVQNPLFMGFIKTNGFEMVSGDGIIKWQKQMI